MERAQQGYLLDSKKISKSTIQQKDYHARSGADNAQFPLRMLLHAITSAGGCHKGYAITPHTYGIQANARSSMQNLRIVHEQRCKEDRLGNAQDRYVEEQRGVT